MIDSKKHYSLRDGAKRPLQAMGDGAKRPLQAIAQGFAVSSAERGSALRAIAQQ